MKDNVLTLAVQPVTCGYITSNTSGSTHFTGSGGSHARQCDATSRCMGSIRNARPGINANLGEKPRLLVSTSGIFIY